MVAANCCINADSRASYFECWLLPKITIIRQMVQCKVKKKDQLHNEHLCAAAAAAAADDDDSFSLRIVTGEHNGAQFSREGGS